MAEITLGSLFDGIGVFPLAAARQGIRPVWAIWATSQGWTEGKSRLFMC